MIKVFIENEAGINKKNTFDENTLVYQDTVEVARPYPFPYGFVLDTKSGDGDNLDCFVLTSKLLKSGDVVKVAPIGMFEVNDSGENDPKILAVLAGESATVDEKMKAVLEDFVMHVFDNQPGKVLKVGNFLGKEEALAVIEKSLER